jgi:4-amino-4-deoxy-L-arabinose transferase-like glycosyltransferase
MLALVQREHGALAWLMLVVVFFSLSPGKRGVYITPALPALAIAALPFIESVLAGAGVRRAGLILASMFFVAAAARPMPRLRSRRCCRWWSRKARGWAAAPS